MIDSLKRKLAPELCSWIPLALWHKLTGVELMLPHWHVVSDDALPHIKGIYTYRNIKQFKEDLNYFLKYYTPITLNDILSHIDGIRSLPKRCFLPSFDDGFSQINDIIAPLLIKKGVSAIFFLVTSVIDNRDLCYPQKKSILISALKSIDKTTTQREISQYLIKSGIIGKDIQAQLLSIYYRQRHILDSICTFFNCDFKEYLTTVKPYLTSEQIIKLMQSGFSIGAHSIDHPLYSELSIEEQLSQTLGSMQQLSKAFDFSCNSFAFPYKDADISKEFFKKAFAQEQLKVTFGIGNIINYNWVRNLPRFSMERTDLPAEKILARQFGRAFFRIR